MTIGAESHAHLPACQLAQKLTRRRVKEADFVTANVIEMFMGASGMNGSPTTRSINGFDLVFAQVTSLELDLEDTEAAMIALETVNGTVFGLISTVIR